MEDLKEELVQAKCQAQKSELLQMEVACLRNEILKRDIALSDYDCQYKQLMVSPLKSKTTRLDEQFLTSKLHFPHHLLWLSMYMYIFYIYTYTSTYL